MHFHIVKMYKDKEVKKWLYQVRVITFFTVFRLLTDFVCLYNYEFWFSLCKIVRRSVILLLPLFRTPYSYYIESPTHGKSNPFYGIMNPLPVVYRTHYPCYIELPIHGISKPLPMIYRTAFPCYIEHPDRGILTPLPMVYRTPSLAEIMGFNLQWWGSK